MKKLFKKAIPIITASFLLVVPITAYADSIYETDLDRTGSITVTMRENDTKTPIGGGALALYKIADAVFCDAGYVFAYTDDFSGCDAALLAEDALAESTTPDTFVSHIEADGIAPIAEVAVSSDGMAVLDGLSVGLYLIRQTVAADGYEFVNPFLVTIPMNADGEAVYDVDATPKTASMEKIEGKKSEDTPAEQGEIFTVVIDEGEESGHTGDDAGILLVTSLAVSALAILLYVICATGGNKSEKTAEGGIE